MKKLLKENFDSQNLFEKLSLLTEIQSTQIIDGLKWTSINYPSAVIIGGTAVIFYLKQSRDLTPDIDFLVDDVSSVKSVLDLNSIPYKPIVGDRGNIGITVEKFNADYLNVTSGNQYVNKLILSTAKPVNIGGVQIKIAIPELLAIMKLELGRNKDADDAFALLSSGILKKDLYVRIITELKSYLSEYESLLSYAVLIK